MAKKKRQLDTVNRDKHFLDASGRIAGRLATEVAILLMGKHKVDYQPNFDQGDFVELENIDKLKFSGDKVEKKVYHHTSGFPGGIKTVSLKKIFKEKPEELFTKIVKNMLPRNKLKKGMIKRLTYKN